MGRLDNLRIVDPVLTNLARGYTNNALVGSMLFPVVEVKKEAGKIPQFGKEAFKVYNTERALRAKSNRIAPEGISTVDFVLTEHDLEYPVDYRESQEAQFDLDQHAVMVVSEGIALRHEKIAADLAQTPANYPTGNKVTLAGSSQFTHPDSNPAVVIETAKDAVRAKVGKRPNVMVMGPAVYTTLRNSASILDRLKYSQTGVVTLDLLKAIFNIPEIYIGEGIYSTDGGVFADIWGDNIVLAYVNPAQDNVPRSAWEPSFGYTLHKAGHPTADTYTEDGKIRVVRSTDNFCVKIVGAEAGYLISDTNA